MVEAGCSKDSSLPDLYFPTEFRSIAIQEIQSGMLNRFIEQAIQRKDLGTINHAIAGLLEETFRDPKIELLIGFKDVVRKTVDKFVEHPDFINDFLLIGPGGYNLAEHSLNVMTLVVSYSFKAKLDFQEIIQLSISALLHDVGKTRLPSDMRNSNRRLSDDEFAIFRNHTLEGQKILSKGDFSAVVLEGVGQHHERLDGSGYPGGIREISLAGQVVGLADCYDALTTKHGIHRHAMQPVECLRLLKREVDQGKFDQAMFEVFAYSLVEK